MVRASRRTRNVSNDSEMGLVIDRDRIRLSVNGDVTRWGWPRTWGRPADRHGQAVVAGRGERLIPTQSNRLHRAQSGREHPFSIAQCKFPLASFAVSKLDPEKLAKHGCAR